MGRPTNEELAEKRNAENQSIMDKLEAMGKRIMGLESENEKLKTEATDTKGKKFKVVGSGNQVDSTWFDNVHRKNADAEAKNSKPMLVKEKDFKGHENKCPYCTSKNQDSLIDLNTRSGRLQCRTCSKSWDKQLLGLPYAEYMESGQFDGATLTNYVKQCQAA